MATLPKIPLGALARGGTTKPVKLGSSKPKPGYLGRSGESGPIGRMHVGDRIQSGGNARQKVEGLKARSLFGPSGNPRARVENLHAYFGIAEYDAEKQV